MGREAREKKAQLKGENEGKESTKQAWSFLTVHTLHSTRRPALVPHVAYIRYMWQACYSRIQSSMRCAFVCRATPRAWLFV